MKDHETLGQSNAIHLNVRRGGKIHSVETCGTVDGPGVRYVVFLQGCGLKCVYCHNADARDVKGGRDITVAELFEDIRLYKRFMQASGGGVTFSGGEPLLQAEFVAELIDFCHTEGIHTAIDTAGAVDLRFAKQALDKTDLVLLDMKSFDADVYKRVTGGRVESPISMAKYLDSIGKATWIRFVLVPGWTDGEENVRGLARFVSTLSNVERVQILPFHKMGEYKWREMNMPYELEKVSEPTLAEVNRVVNLFKEAGVQAEV